MIRLLARRGVRQLFYLCFGAVGFVAGVWRRAAPVRPSPDVRSVLVIRLDLLGDVVLTLPAVAALRAAYPRASIVMLTLPYTAQVAAQDPDVDEVVAVDTNLIRRPSGLIDPGTWLRYWRVWRDLRRRRFDLCVSVYGRMGSLCAFLVGARRSVGFAGEEYPGLLTDPLPGGRYDRRRHEVEYAREVATYAGARSTPQSVAITTGDSVHESARLLLAAHGVADRDKLVLIHAGSINGSAKRWPALSWAQFGDRLLDRGCAVVLIGAASEHTIGRMVLDAAARRPISLVGQTDLPTLTALIGRASLVASGDSGPLHLAVALGRPVLGVYGPTDPVISGPSGSSVPSRVLRHDLPCSPCYTLARSAECPLGDPICMRLVTVDRMVEAALELLDGPTSASGYLKEPVST